MKAKISRGGGFRGAVSYVLDKGEAENVGGNMSGRTVSELTSEFGITKKLRPDCKNPVWHCSLALPEGDRLSAEKWGVLAADFMKEMGMDPSNFLYTVQRHSDTDHDHIHIVASRIGLDGSLWHGQNDVLAAINATQKLENLHQLTLTPGLDFERKNDRKRLTAQESYMGLRTEMKPPRQVCQEAIDAVLQSEGVMSAPEFIKRLAAFGVNAVPSVATTGTMNGFSFEAEGIPFTGSKLGDSYKWAQLQKRGIEYVKVRDFEELADARRRAAERAAAQRDDGADLAATRRDSAPGAELGAVAGLGSAAGDRSDAGAGPGATDAPGREQGVRSLQPSDSSAAQQLGADVGRNQREDGAGDAAEGRRPGPDDTGAGQPGAGPEIDVGQHAGQQQGPASLAAETDYGGRGRSGRDEDEQREAGGGGAGRAPQRVADRGPDAGSRDAGRNAGGGWASRFKQNSAARRDAAERGLRSESVGQSLRVREKVADADRIQARQIDPTAYLESQGFQVIKEGRHLSVRQHGDEAYRCTRKDDSHWVTCDKYGNGIGDNIALISELEPGIGFAESVYRLSGAPSVAMASRPAPAPVMRKPPQMPAQGPEDVRRGREYLRGRGIELETIEAAEKAGMLRYSARGVLFVGRDEQGTAQNVMRRAIDVSELHQKRDLAGTDKRHPQMILGAAETVLIVEGGIDALAAVDIARREKRPAPTILVSGGANVKGFMQTEWVQKILKLARKVVVAFERESTPEVQAKTDAAHQAQMQRLQEVCTAQVTSWKPPEGVKDMAALNAHQVQEAERRELAKQAQEAARPKPSYPTPRM